jgi:hypothetical protein
MAPEVRHGDGSGIVRQPGREHPKPGQCAFHERTLPATRALVERLPAGDGFEKLYRLYRRKSLAWKVLRLAVLPGRGSLRLVGELRGRRSNSGAQAGWPNAAVTGRLQTHAPVKPGGIMGARHRGC